MPKKPQMNLKKQEELLSETLKKLILLYVYLIPGKKLNNLKEGMLDNMNTGSIIYDLAAVQGGNTSATKADEVAIRNGVRIMGDTNILNKLPISASNLYSNIYNFILNLYDKEKEKLI